MNNVRFRSLSSEMRSMSPSCGLRCDNGKCVFDFMGNPTCECDEGYELKNSECDGSKIQFLQLFYYYTLMIFSFFSHFESQAKSGSPNCPLTCENGRCIFDFMGIWLKIDNGLNSSLV